MSDEPVANIHHLDLDSFWSDEDPSVAHRGQWLIHSEAGAENSAATYFEIDAGKRIGRHTHDAEESLVILHGTATIAIGERTLDAGPGTVALVPEDEWHDIENTSSGPLRALGFFPKAEVKTTFEVALQPADSKEMGSPGAS